MDNNKTTKENEMIRIAGIEIKEDTMIMIGDSAFKASDVTIEGDEKIIKTESVYLPSNWDGLGAKEYKATKYFIVWFKAFFTNISIINLANAPYVSHRFRRDPV